MGIPAEFFFPFTFIERQSVGTRSKKGWKKRSVLHVGKYSQYIFVHIRLKKKKRNMWKKGRRRRIYIYAFSLVVVV